MFAMKFAIWVYVGRATCCQERLSHAIVVKLAYRRNDKVIWILYRHVLKYVAKASLVGCITAKRGAMLGIVRLVWYLSPKNVVADQLIELWNATKQ
ncbi:hypothetical protein ACSBR2_024333 [Camellia fascicularis]